MKPFRIIPILLIENRRLVKTVNYKKPSYIGDPINAVRIFNAKEVDELVLLDIRAHRQGINFDHIRKIVPEAFMPIAYGGGIRTTEEIRKLLRMGVEKVVLGSAAVENPDLVAEAALRFGSQSVIVSVDVKTGLFGHRGAYHRNATRLASRDPLAFAQAMEKTGAGEILLNDVDREGTMSGMDEALIQHFSRGLGVPLVASGGAGSIQDLVMACTTGGAQAVAAGSLFVYKGPLKAVLINYPQEEALTPMLQNES